MAYLTWISPYLVVEYQQRILDPKNTWPDKKKYESSARILARLFVKNFEKFGKMPKEIQKAGPLV